MDKQHFALDPSVAVDREFCIRRNKAWTDCPYVELSSLEKLLNEVNGAKVRANKRSLQGRRRLAKVEIAYEKYASSRFNSKATE
ncbi:unnamed protein product, partial [Strongylus vulgaris]